MAKVVKDERKTIDVDLELAKIESEKKEVKKAKAQKLDNNKKLSNKKIKKLNNKKNRKKHGKIFNFFKEVKVEVSKVKWPSKKNMVKYSVATIIFILFFAIFFYLIDLVIALLKAGV